MGLRCNALSFGMGSYAKSPRHGDSTSMFSEAVLSVAENNSSMAGGDLADYYRFGRVDYLKVDVLTTVFMIPKPPLIVFSHLPEDAPSPARMADLELRFLRLGTIRPNATDLHDFLKDEYWKYIAPWKNGWFSPDGPYAFILPPIGRFFSFFHLYTDRIPNWLLLIGSGAFANMLVGLMHRPGKGPKPPARWEQPKKKEAAPAWGSSSAVTEGKKNEWAKKSEAAGSSAGGGGKKKRK
ncbi:hypothetical protein BT69DRAFT_1289540 [Atractiella rhizophila]|nr:hypothetical protein BT69DRAFT_1289540 [Atractiella rhizophila]